MKNTTVRGIPDGVFAKIQRQAARSRRSVNAQIVYLLEQEAAAADYVEEARNRPDQRAE